MDAVNDAQLIGAPPELRQFYRSRQQCAKEISIMEKSLLGMSNSAAGAAELKAMIQDKRQEMEDTQVLLSSKNLEVDLPVFLQLQEALRSALILLHRLWACVNQPGGYARLAGYMTYGRIRCGWSSDGGTIDEHVHIHGLGHRAAGAQLGEGAQLMSRCSRGSQGNRGSCC
eukprot:COSAG01_NODE_1000_length_12213_cov_20.853063_5_plen_171_part_00